MIDKDTVKKAIDIALNGGGDYAEIFMQDSWRNLVEYRNQKVENAIAGRDFGIGIRVLSGTNSVYSYTCDSSASAIVEIALAVADAIGQIKTYSYKDFIIKPARKIQFATVSPANIDANKRAQIARSAHDAAKAYSPEIVQATAGVFDAVDNVAIATSEGIWVEDTRVRSRLMLSAVASNGSEMQTGVENPGAGRGFEFFQSIDIEGIASKAAKTAVTMLHAPFAPAGRMQVAIENAFGGVIFHEACGHSLEATAVAKGNSEFCGKLGMQIASSKVTAIDDGSRPGEWGSLGYDDEGNKTRKNVLIENGILTGYMIDILGARRMNMPVTGNARRQNYRFAPTSRMTNTYIDCGTDENILESIAYGLYAAKMGGGSVNPVTGEFNFSVQEGYIIKNGKIDRPVRGATLIGKGSEVLNKIDMVGTNLALAEGMCGSISGSVPTRVGQPLIRVSDLIVGGKEQ